MDTLEVDLVEEELKESLMARVPSNSNQLRRTSFVNAQGSRFLSTVSRRTPADVKTFSDCQYNSTELCCRRAHVLRTLTEHRV